MSTQTLLESNGNTYLTVPEVAHVMGVSRTKAMQWARDGAYGAHKHAGMYVFPSEKILLLSVEEVASMLRVNVQTVRRWARDGVQPAIKIGRRYYFSRAKLLDTTH